MITEFNIIAGHGHHIFYAQGPCGKDVCLKRQPVAVTATNLKDGLKAVYETTLELFRVDPRVVAAYMSGSVGTEGEDDYSDVDPVLLIQAEEFEVFDHDLRGIFHQVGVRPVLWWPERINCETLRNYAVLFERERELLQYDITIRAVDAGSKVPVTSAQAIFDKAGVLQIVEQPPQACYSPERLRWTIEMYWLYVYIHAKYLARDDSFRLAAAQHELLHCHLEVLRALRPEVPRDWWPIMAKRLCDGATEEVCLSYLGSLNSAAVSRALVGQTGRFSQDARAACAKWSIAYPADFEARAVRHVEAAMQAGVEAVRT